MPDYKGSLLWSKPLAICPYREGGGGGGGGGGEGGGGGGGGGGSGA